MELICTCGKFIEDENIDFRSGTNELGEEYVEVSAVCEFCEKEFSASEYCSDCYSADDAKEILESCYTELKLS